MAKSPILTGWKAITEYLNLKDENAARRLAEEEGLPVVKTKGNVFSSVNAIEAWIIKNGSKTIANNKIG